MNKKYIVMIALFGFTTLIISENFIVKKAKQITVAYEDQWLDLFGKLMRLFAYFDIQKGKLQKSGIQDVMSVAGHESAMIFVQFSRAQQQEMVADLQKILDHTNKSLQLIDAYNKKWNAFSGELAKKKKE